MSLETVTRKHSVPPLLMGCTVTGVYRGHLHAEQSAHPDITCVRAADQETLHVASDRLELESFPLLEHLRTS